MFEDEKTVGVEVAIWEAGTCKKLKNENINGKKEKKKEKKNQ